MRRTRKLKISLRRSPAAPSPAALEKSEGGMELDEENHQVQHLIEKVFTSRQVAEIHPTTNIQTDRLTEN